jgi:hypothetical protein
LYRWAWIGIDSDGVGHHSLLARRAADGTLAYYLAWHRQPVALPTLVAVAGRRWMIEEAFQVTKDQFGLDHAQVRSWHGWHRHATLTMLAFALTVLAVHDDQPQSATTVHELAHPTGPIAVTINEAATSSPRSSSPHNPSDRLSCSAAAEGGESTTRAGCGRLRLHAVDATAG